MSRGQPDFGLYGSTPVASGISDPGESAARLGSINVYDRRGWTVWMDDFEEPALKWAANAIGLGLAPVLSTVRSYMGTQSLSFWTWAGAGARSQASRAFSLIRLGRVGIEFTIYLGTSTPGYFRLYFRIYDGVNYADADLRLDSEARTATIITPDGPEVVATNCFRVGANRIWLPVKLVVDMDTDMYTRLLIGPQEIDLSPYALVAGLPTTERLIEVFLQLQGDVAGDMEANLDNFILTQNEP